MSDATYLAVADIADAPLLTLDRDHDLATAMGLGRTGDRRASEPTTTYAEEHQLDRVSIAAIGKALAEMRREYSL